VSARRAHHTAHALALSFACALALTLTGALVPAHAAVTAPASTRSLAAGLARGGRAEVTLRWTAPAIPGGRAERLRGTLAVEPPDRARLDVPATGERITLRSDGGEWLQPSLHQMMLLKARHSVAAMRWWRLLAGAEPANERRLGPRRYRLVLAATPAAPADSAEVSLDAAGLPARLELDDGTGGRLVYELSGWRFTRARGAAAFRVSAPAGIETVELP